MTAEPYSDRVYEFASDLLEDEPNLFTLHHNHHLACAIQKAIAAYIKEAKDNYEPPDPPGFEDGFCENH